MTVSTNIWLECKRRFHKEVKTLINVSERIAKRINNFNKKDIRLSLFNTYREAINDEQWEIIKWVESFRNSWIAVKIDILTPPMVDFLKHYLNYEIKRKCDGRWLIVINTKKEKCILVHKRKEQSVKEKYLQSQMQLLVMQKTLNKLTEAEWKVIEKLENRKVVFNGKNRWIKLAVNKLTLRLISTLIYYFQYEIMSDEDEKIIVFDKKEIKIRKRNILSELESIK